MENPKYIIIETKKDSKKVNGIINKIGILKEFYKKRLYYKLPLIYESIDILHVPGKKIILPFHLEELNEFKKEKITDMLNRIIITEGTQNIVVEKLLDNYVDPSLFIDGKIIPYLYLDEIIRMIRRYHKIPEKNLRLKIIDSNSIDLEEILSASIDKLNYLTIITDREQELEGLVDKIYQETGLLIVLKNKKCLNEPYEEMNEKMNKDLILDLSEEHLKNIYCLQKNAIYVDLSYDKEKMKMIMAKRKDVTYYNKFEFMVDDQNIDNRILQAIVCGNATWITKGDMKGLAEDVKQYPIHLEKVSITFEV